GLPYCLLLAGYRSHQRWGFETPLSASSVARAHYVDTCHPVNSLAFLYAGNQDWRQTLGAANPVAGRLGVLFLHAVYDTLRGGLLEMKGTPAATHWSRALRAHG